MNLKYLLFALATVAVVTAEKVTYEGYKLYKVIPKDIDTVNLLKDAAKRGVGELWDDHFGPGQAVKIMVAPQNAAEFVAFVDANHIEHKEIIPDIQKVIEEQMKPSDLSRFSQQYLSLSWTEYHNLERMNAWLDELAENHPGVVSTVVMGQSVLGDDIKGIIINYNPERTKQIGVLEGALHAREWISPATVTWIIKEFLTSTDPDIRALAEGIEWHIFPVVNPDGYKYTFTTNRMWRKNRSTASYTSCASWNVDDDLSNGVDLNRNFGFQWMTIGASEDPCSNLFAGPSAFSEPEARAIRSYVLSLKEKGDFLYYVAFHSYTQLIIVPYSHLSTEDPAQLPENYADMYEVAVSGANALKERFGTEYRVGISADVMYEMSGTSFDWVKYEANVPITYLIELRDLGEYGFLLSPEQIIPTGLETMDALVEMHKTTTRLGYFSSASGIVSSLTIMIVGVFAVLFM